MNAKLPSHADVLLCQEICKDWHPANDQKPTSMESWDATIMT